MQKELLSQRQYAKRLRVSAALVNQYVKKGIVTLVNGKIDPELADQELEMTSNPNRKKLKFQADEATYSGEWPDEWPG